MQRQKTLETITRAGNVGNRVNYTGTGKGRVQGGLEYGVIRRVRQFESLMQARMIFLKGVARPAVFRFPVPPPPVGNGESHKLSLSLSLCLPSASLSVRKQLEAFK